MTMVSCNKYSSVSSRWLCGIKRAHATFDHVYLDRRVDTLETELRRRILQVPDFGWIDRPLPSAEENCLTWSISISRRSSRMNEGWHSDSCCNSIRFICEV